MTLEDIAKMIPRGKITTPSGDAYHLSRFGRLQMLEAVEAAIAERTKLCGALQSIAAGNLDGETEQMFADRCMDEARAALAR